MKKINEWLETLGSHDIYVSAPLKRDFKKETGEEATWPEFTETKTRKLMRDRGLGGTLPPAKGEMLAYGYTIAIHLAGKHVPGFSSTKLGRGSAFQEAVEALKEAGK